GRGAGLIPLDFGPMGDHALPRMPTAELPDAPARWYFLATRAAARASDRQPVHGGGHAAMGGSNRSGSPRRRLRDHAGQAGKRPGPSGGRRPGWTAGAG